MKRAFFGGVHPKGYKELSREAAIVPLHPSVVSVAMSQHIGAPCQPLVKVGDRVTVGQKIGDGQGLCVPVHASVSGTVTAIEARPHPGGNLQTAIVIESDGRDTLCPTVKPRDPEAVAAMSAEDLIAVIREAGITMTFCSLGSMTRYVRASMIDALSMDCIRTARAKGVKEKTVIYSHAWRNALIPIVTMIVGWFTSIFAGSLIFEDMFGLNGMGKLMISSLRTSDYDVTILMQLFYVVVALLGNLVIDIVYGLVDPRVRVNK